MTLIFPIRFSLYGPSENPNSWLAEFIQMVLDACLLWVCSASYKNQSFRIIVPLERGFPTWGLLPTPRGLYYARKGSAETFRKSKKSQHYSRDTLERFSLPGKSLLKPPPVHSP